MSVEHSAIGPLVVATGALDLVRQVFHPHEGPRVRLSAREATLLRYLADQAPEAVDRDELRVRVWEHHRLSMSRAVDATVARLRKKIDNEGNPCVLVTVHGTGYRLVLGDEVPPAPEAPARPPLVLGDRTIDLVTGTVATVDGEAALTAHERFLLDLLLQARGGWVSPERVGRMLGASRHSTRATSLVYRLRQKVEDDPGSPVFVESRRGYGYRLVVEAEVRAPGSELRLAALRQLARHVGDLLGYDDCVVWARSGDHLEQLAAWGPKRDGDGIRAPMRLRVGEGLVGAAALGDPVRVADTREDPRYRRDLEPARSELCVPILAGGAVVGVLDSESPFPNRYTLHDEIVFLSLATIAAASFTSPGSAP